MLIGDLNWEVKAMAIDRRYLWEEFFPDRILERGLDYCVTQQNILEFHMNDRSVEAVIAGTDAYLVNIALEGERIVGMSCTCPYAERGFFCKHMAAALYEYEIERLVREKEGTNNTNE